MKLIEMSTEITDTSNIIINVTNLKGHLIEILSPNSTLSVNPQNHQSLHIHCHRSLNIQPNTPQYIQFQERHSFALMLSIMCALISFAAPKSELALPKIRVNVTQMHET